MKCSKCGSDNNSDATFCVSCGSKLEKEINSTNTNNANANIQNTTNVNSNKQKNKWLTIGLPIAIGIILIIAIFGSNSNETTYSNDFDTTDARTEFGNYLVSYGFTRNSITNYTMYYEGYLVTIDYNDAIMSMENSTMYTAYYYKTNIFGIAAVNSGTKIVAAYDLSTYEYSCETEPSTYQNYTCSYVKSSFIELARTGKNTFDTLANAAGISANDL